VLPGSAAADPFYHLLEVETMKLTKVSAVLLLGLALAGPCRAESKSIRDVVRNSLSQIVRIEVSGTKLVKTSADQVKEVAAMSSGTGFLIDARGYIVTNAHVVLPDAGMWKAAPAIRVKFAGVEGLPQRATLTGYDDLSDLAVLHVKPDTILSAFNPGLLTADGRWRALKFATAVPEVGEDVVAIGFAQGQEGAPTVTKGIVGATRRSLVDGIFSGLLQMDAAINRGNSGGPLLNMRGEVVGVNTYGMPSSINVVRQGEKIGLEADVAHGIFYARDCGTAAPFVQMLIRNGRVHRASLGLDIDMVKTLAQEEARALRYLSPGALIAAVPKSSPADAAGLRVGDVITQLDWNLDDPAWKAWKIANVGDLFNALAFIPPGERVRVLFLRPGKETLRALVSGQPVPEAEHGNAVLHVQIEAAILATK
jgi:serine protease Do